MSNIYFSSFGSRNLFEIDLPHNKHGYWFSLCNIHTNRPFPSLVLHPKVQCSLSCITWNGSTSWSQRQLNQKAGYGESLKTFFRKIQREFSGFLPGIQSASCNHDSHEPVTPHLALPLPFISTLKVAFLRLGLTLPRFPLAFQRVHSNFIFLSPFSLSPFLSFFLSKCRQT